MSKVRKSFVTGELPGARLWTILFFIYLYTPMVVLVVYSFNKGRLGQIWDGFGLRWYIKAFSNDDIQRAAFNSLLVATVATGIAVVLATLAALMLGRKDNFRGKAFSVGMISLPLVVPEIATAVATLCFFSVIGMSLSLTTVIIAHTVFCIPFAFLPIRVSLCDVAVTNARHCRWRDVVLYNLNRRLHYYVDGGRCWINHLAALHLRHDSSWCDPGGKCHLDGHAGNIGSVYHCLLAADATSQPSQLNSPFTHLDE